MRRAAMGGEGGKWWSGKGLRESNWTGRRRKWWSTGREVEGEVAFMTTCVGSRWGIGGCGENAAQQLDTTLVRDMDLRPLYQP